MDAFITKFKQTGIIYLWKFKDNQRNFPGWNISFDERGANFLVRLLELMDCSEWSSKKLLDIKQPNHKILNRINNRMGNASWVSANKLNLQYKKNEENLWITLEDNNQIDLLFGPKKIIEFRDAITDKAFDIGIADSNDDNILYFWAN